MGPGQNFSSDDNKAFSSHLISIPTVNAGEREHYTPNMNGTCLAFVLLGLLIFFSLRCLMKFWKGEEIPGMWWKKEPLKDNNPFHKLCFCP